MSPDGDGINDDVHLRVCAPAGVRVEGEAWHWGNGRHGEHRWILVWSTTRAASIRSRRCGSGQRAAVVRWRGEIGDSRPGRAPQTTYRVTACAVGRGRRTGTARDDGAAFLTHLDDDIDDLATQRVGGREPRARRHVPASTDPLRSDVPEGSHCLARPVLVHVRRAMVSAATMHAANPGTEVAVDTDTDAPGSRVTLTVERAVSSRTPPVLTVHGRPPTIMLPADLASGLYRLRMTVDPAPGHPGSGSRACAPLVVRNPAVPVAAPAPRTALVVYPYLTWRAYNQLDADGDGYPDTWYQHWTSRRVSLSGGWEHLAGGDGCLFSDPFQRWLPRDPGRQYQVVTDVELARLTQSVIDRYASLWFPMHSEYFEQDTYDRVRAFRDHGHGVVLLSANNFFRPVRISRGTNTMRLLRLASRAHTTSDYRLTGVGFTACCFPHDRFAPSIATSDVFTRAPWLLQGTGLAPGDGFGTNGIEIDDIAPARLRPPSVVVVGRATIRTRPRRHATMAIAGWPSGGEVFNAGTTVFTLWLRSPLRRDLATRMLDNLWARYVVPAA